MAQARCPGFDSHRLSSFHFPLFCLITSNMSSNYCMYQSMCTLFPSFTHGYTLLPLIHPWVHPPPPHSPIGTPSSPSFTHGYTLLTLIHPHVYPPPPHSPTCTPSSPSFTPTCTPSSPSFTHMYTLLPLIDPHVHLASSPGPFEKSEKMA